jgi:peptidoglycan/xylan/chitin deacetylase (PgdA/CDA1 family)
MTEDLISRRDLFRGVAGLTAAAVGATAALGEILPAGAVSLPTVSGVVSSASGLNLRTRPGASQPVVKWLPNGTPLAIRGTSADWFKVTALGLSGWVNSWYVLLRGTKSTEVRRGNSAIKRVALTFDCGSDRGYTDQILSTLANHGIRASFGMTGAWMSANPDSAKKIASGGYQFINHTLSHPSYTGASTPGAGPASPAKRLAQIQANENAIRTVTGMIAKPYWRPPYGDIDDGVLRDVGALGYSKTAMWTIDSLGWNGLTADEIYSRVMNNMVWGAIVLMHVGAASQDANALDRIIRDLKAQHYTFATVAQVMA